MKQTENFKIEKDISKYYRYLVKLRVEAGRIKTEAEKSIDNPSKYERIEGEPKPVSRFRDLINQLLDNYFYKFSRRKDIERPDCLKDQEKPPNVRALQWNELENIYYKISKLQEKLGHTSIASKEWKATEGVGGKETAKKVGEKT